MRILFLSFYFEPDLSAGSFRNTALLNELLNQAPDYTSIDVITTLPSRYSNYTVKAKYFEKRGAANIYRTIIPAHKNNMLDQPRTFLSYLRQVIKITKANKYDLIYASSSRLLTASLGAYLARKLNVTLYLDIRDIFVDTIKELPAIKLFLPLKSIFSIIEKWSFSQAGKINLVSEGFKDYFETNYPKISLSFFTNGIDDEFLINPVNATHTAKRQIPVVVYAGNIGIGQGLHNIVPALAKHFEGQLKFRIIGEGSRRTRLVEVLKSNSVNNVEIIKPMSRSKLLQAYQDSDILFMHLNNYDAFLKVLPSKIFEYAALGKPIWAGVAGYSASFINQYMKNVAVFNPCDKEGAIASFQKLSLNTEPRSDFVEIFSRANIMKKMAADILRLSDATKL